MVVRLGVPTLEAKAVTQNKVVIAALKRCATHNFNCRIDFFCSLLSRALPNHDRAGIFQQPARPRP